MSLTLLKRSLAIVEEDLPNNSKTEKSTKNVNNNVFKKSAYKLKKKRIKQKIFPMESSANEKLTIETIRANARTNNKTEENLSKLLKLGKVKPKLDDETKAKIFQRAITGRYVVPVDKQTPKEEETIFSEEDFKAFEMECLSRS